MKCFSAKYYMLALNLCVGIELSTKQNSQSMDKKFLTALIFNMAAECELSRACGFVNAEESRHRMTRRVVCTAMRASTCVTLTISLLLYINDIFVFLVSLILRYTRDIMYMYRIITQSNRTHDKAMVDLHVSMFKPASAVRILASQDS